jgi:hypothetical protein
MESFKQWKRTVWMEASGMSEEEDWEDEEDEECDDEEE